MLTRESLGQLFRYIFTGLISFGIEYSLFILLYRVFEIWYITSHVSVYIVVFWFNFFVNRLWSFKSKSNLQRQLSMYTLLFVFNLIVATLIMYLLSEILRITPLISKVLVMGMTVSWNFIIYKTVIYKK
jgi:putative flippase GtrA